MNSYKTKQLKAALHQVERNIAIHGDSYCFKSYKPNEFGEPSDETTEVVLQGLWHTTNSFIQQTTSEASKINSKQQPQILCKYEDSKMLTKDDTLITNERCFKVTEIIDVGNFNMIGDICLEEIK